MLGIFSLYFGLQVVLVAVILAVVPFVMSAVSWRVGTTRLLKHVAARRMQSTYTWQPALKPGTLPVYDEALKHIEHDSATLRDQIAKEKQQADMSSTDVQERVYALEVASDINQPSVRAQFRRGTCTYLWCTKLTLCDRLHGEACIPPHARAGMATRRRSEPADRTHPPHACLARRCTQDHADRGSRGSLWLWSRDRRSRWTRRKCAPGRFPRSIHHAACP